MKSVKEILCREPLVTQGLWGLRTDIDIRPKAAKGAVHYFMWTSPRKMSTTQCLYRPATRRLGNPKPRLEKLICVRNKHIMEETQCGFFWFSRLCRQSVELPILGPLALSASHHFDASVVDARTAGQCLLYSGFVRKPAKPANG